LIYFVIIICFLAFVALLLLGGIGAFFLCFPVLPTALVAVILVGMASLFLLGFWVGNARKVSANYDFDRHPTEWLRELLGQHIGNDRTEKKLGPEAALRDS
jgi:uncharacterized membrane protein (DUF485 family)